MHKCAQIGTHVQAHMYMHNHGHAYVSKHVYTGTDTCAHMYANMDTHMHTQLLQVLPSKSFPPTMGPPSLHLCSGRGFFLNQEVPLYSLLPFLRNPSGQAPQESSAEDHLLSTSACSLSLNPKLQQDDLEMEEDLAIHRGVHLIEGLTWFPSHGQNKMD